MKGLKLSSPVKLNNCLNVATAFLQYWFLKHRKKEVSVRARATTNINDKEIPP